MNNKAWDKFLQFLLPFLNSLHEKFCILIPIIPINRFEYIYIVTIKNLNFDFIKSAYAQETRSGTLQVLNFG